MLRRENCRLRAQIEADEAAANAEPSSSTNGNSEKIAIVPLGDEMSEYDQSSSFSLLGAGGGGGGLSLFNICPRRSGW